MLSNPIDVRTESELDVLISEKTINQDITIRGEYLVEMKGVRKIKGSLCLFDCSINNLGILEEIEGDLIIYSKTVYQNLKSLDKIFRVGGDLILRYSNIENLGSLKKVGGKINLRDTRVNDFSVLEYVGGDLFLPKRLENKVDLSKIKILGKVKYWNNNKFFKTPKPNSEIGYIEYEGDVPVWYRSHIYSYKQILEANEEQRQFYSALKSNFLVGKYLNIRGNNHYAQTLYYDLMHNYNSNIEDLKIYIQNYTKYYPNAVPILEDCLSLYIKNKLFEEALELILDEGYPERRLNYLFEIESKSDLRVLTNDLILLISKDNSITEVGNLHFDEIVRIFRELVKEEISDNRNLNFRIDPFWSIFLNSEGKPYPVNYFWRFFKSRREFNKRIKEDDLLFMNPITVEESRIYPDKFDEIGALHPELTGNLITNAFKNFVSSVIIKAEDVFRRNNNLPSVKEFKNIIIWKSEFELYSLIKQRFKKEIVKYQASPKWLGNQSLDIYFPNSNIAIEYQGLQHYKPIEFFGGEKSFRKNQERDRKKKKLCLANNCDLVYVKKGYKIQDIYDEIERLIDKKYKIYQSDYSIRKTPKKSIVAESLKLSSNREIYDCKEQNFITWDEFKKLYPKAQLQNLLKRKSLYKRYVLKSKLNESDLPNTWKTIINTETKEVLRFNKIEFANHVGVKQNSVWNFFKGNQQIFHGIYQVLTEGNAQQ